MLLENPFPIPEDLTVSKIAYLNVDQKANYRQISGVLVDLFLDMLPCSYKVVCSERREVASLSLFAFYPIACLEIIIRFTLAHIERSRLASFAARKKTPNSRGVQATVTLLVLFSSAFLRGRPNALLSAMSIKYR